MPTATLTKGVASRSPHNFERRRPPAAREREGRRRDRATLALLLFPPNVPEQRRNPKVDPMEAVIFSYLHSFSPPLSPIHLCFLSHARCTASSSFGWK